MELKYLIKTLKKQSRLLTISTLVFGVIGFLFFYFFPTVYKATGSFYVSRGVAEVSQLDFTYEGYYAQQAGTKYTGTLIGLLESVDIRKVALDNLGIPVTETTLREASRNIRAKKAAPQLVTLTTKALSPELAERFWITLSEAVVESSDKLNETAGDPMLTVIPVGEGPIVHEGFNDLFVSVTVGVLFGLLVGSFIAAFKEYLS